MKDRQLRNYLLYKLPGFETMTDRQKRAAIDEKLKVVHPELTTEEIAAMREDYLDRRFGTVHYYDLPQPADRGDWCRTLDRKTLRDEITAQRYSFDSLIFFLFFLPIFLTIFCVSVYGILHLDSICDFLIDFILVLMFGFLTAISLEWVICFWPGRIKTRRRVMEDALVIRRYLVVDTQIRDETTLSDDSPCIRYFLHLTGPNGTKPWTYECNKDIYRSMREGEMVYLVYLPDETDPFFLFQTINWKPDEDIRSLMTKADTQWAFAGR